MQKKIEFDVVVVGGGIGGVCAAIAAARQGAKTALIQDRSVLGGNASSEIRVHIGGAPQHGYHYDARETGILEEIRLETAVRDPDNQYIWIDTVLYTYCKNEPNLSLYLNTTIYAIETQGSNIVSVKGVQLGSEHEFNIHGKIFIDGTGDGTLGFLAGAEFRIGREAKSEFNEANAPEIADTYTQGSSILFRAEDRGNPIPFTPPPWAIKFTKETIAHHAGSLGKSVTHEKYWHSDTSGWWWVEYGGMIDLIHDNEEIKHRLQAIAFGIWDYIKNHDPRHMKEAVNFELTWIGQVPGKRESRRLIGDVILTENDLLGMRVWEDQIAVGGWSIDLHPPEGFYNPKGGAFHTYMDLPYSIPYRSIYSKNIGNLIIASRCLSVSHVAHASTRLIATLALVGQAAGTAAALCVQKELLPRSLGQQAIMELQQELLKGDQYLLGLRNEDPKDLARGATITATSEYPCEFGDPDHFVMLGFPMAQRFYLPPHSPSNELTLSFYLKNDSNSKRQLTGGVRLDVDQREFIAAHDLATFTITVPANFQGWCEAQLSGPKVLFTPGGNFWVYLNEDEEACWGKSWHHWPGFRIGYLFDEKEWLTLRPHRNPYYDGIIGARGHFCFKIEGVPSPFPASAILNGENRPYRSPNVWFSAPYRIKSLTKPEEIFLNDDSPHNVEICLNFGKEVEITQILFTFENDLDNPYPYGNDEALSIKDWPLSGKAPACIRDLDVFIESPQQHILIYALRENYQRRVKIQLNDKISTKKLIIIPRKNWGFKAFALYEIRIY
jgi:hypothetical protein